MEPFDMEGSLGYECNVEGRWSRVAVLPFRFAKRIYFDFVVGKAMLACDGTINSRLNLKETTVDLCGMCAARVRVRVRVRVGVRVSVRVRVRLRVRFRVRVRK
jgi:hypothetical protein